MASKTSLQDLLIRHIPAPAVPYCLDLWNRYPFELKIRKSRLTKAGDFCLRPGHNPVITLNNDLPPFLFLVTYIHEFSHHAVAIVYGNRPEPHGREWKAAFQTFMKPVLEMGIFPVDLQLGLERHLIDPPASTFSDPVLSRLFIKYDPDKSGNRLVGHLKEGEIFRLRGKTLKRGELKRTRYTCTEAATGRTWLVPADLPIDPS